MAPRCTHLAILRGESIPFQISNRRIGLNRLVKGSHSFARLRTLCFVVHILAVKDITASMGGPENFISVAGAILGGESIPFRIFNRRIGLNHLVEGSH